jgi:hypothetical protein
MYTISVFIDAGDDVISGSLQAEDENHFYDAQFPLAAASLLVRMLRTAGVTADVVSFDGQIVKV